MAFTLSVPRQQPSGCYQTATGGATVKRLDAYTPPFNPEEFSATLDAVLCVAFTPTSGSITIDPDGGATITGGTVREYLSIRGESIAGAHYFRAFARRKPGTTGAIVAQVVTFTISAVEVGRFSYAAAAASTDPISGSIEMTMAAIDGRFDVTSDNIEITMDVGADPDIEVFFEIAGAS